MEAKQLSESMEQILFVNWMRKNHKEHRIFHIPNGGARGAATAARLKNEGVTKGIPDLFCPSLGWQGIARTARLDCVLARVRLRGLRV